jgi:uncharacterized protein YggE
MFYSSRLAVFVSMVAMAAGYVVASPAFAQEIRPEAASGYISGITVSGHAEEKVQPDIARTTLSVNTQSADEVAAVQTNATKMQAVMQALAKSQVADRDIHTSDYEVQPVYDYRPSPPVLTGYSVANSVDIIIRDISKAGLILDKAVAAGATSTGGLNFDLADKNKVQGETLVAAVADARSKADLIAGAAGVSLGRVLSIGEQGATQSIVPMYRPMNAMIAGAAAAPTTPVSPQAIDITADVTATFAINYSSSQ